MKRLGVVIGVIAIITLLIFGIYKVFENSKKGETIISHNNIFTDELLKNIEKVEMVYGIDSIVVIEDKDDIKSFYNIIKPMKLNEFTMDKRDFPIGITITFSISTQDKTVITASVFSDKIHTIEKWYYTDKDYCESLRKLYEKLSK